MQDQQARLEAAYRATTYVVRDGFAQIALRVGQRSPEADRLLARRRRRRAYVLSADNPGSLLRPPLVNRRARLALPPGPPTEARADAGDWPVERGVLAFVDKREARRWLRRLRQRAALCVAFRRAPVLVWSKVGYFGR